MRFAFVSSPTSTRRRAGTGVQLPEPLNEEAPRDEELLFDICCGTPSTCVRICFLFLPARCRPVPYSGQSYRRVEDRLLVSPRAMCLPNDRKKVELLTTRLRTLPWGESFPKRRRTASSAVSASSYFIRPSDHILSPQRLRRDLGRTKRSWDCFVNRSYQITFNPNCISRAGTANWSIEPAPPTGAPVPLKNVLLFIGARKAA